MAHWGIYATLNHTQTKPHSIPNIPVSDYKMSVLETGFCMNILKTVSINYASMNVVHINNRLLEIAFI